MGKKAKFIKDAFVDGPAGIWSVGVAFGLSLMTLSYCSRQKNDTPIVNDAPIIEEVKEYDYE